MKQLITIILLLSAFSCQNKKDTVDSTPPADTVSADFADARKSFFNNMKEPGEVAAQLEATGAEFKPGLMNDPMHFSMYTSDPVKAAANLGVYIADLNYSVAYKQTEKTKAYFTAAHDLSKATGIEKEALDFLAKRYEENIKQNDSAKAIVAALMKKSTSDLEGTERERLAGIAMAAYQIESLHIALGVIQTYPKDLLPDDARTVILVPLFKLVLDQQSNVESIYGYLKATSDVTTADKNPNFVYYTNAFEELIATYKKLDYRDKLANNTAVEIMNDAVVNDLIAKVDAIRNKIVSQE